MIAFRTVNADGLRFFYREAGDPTAPAILLLHGFPSSSHMFRNLIPLLADRFRVVAPDLPGFGFSEAPGRGSFEYTFDRLARVVERFTEAVGLERYAIYVFDYGAPVGFRLALARPERITAVISQNGNAYEEGLSQGWNPIRRYWNAPTAENRAALRDFLKPETTKWQYVHGVADESLVAPESYALDAALLARPGNDEIQLDLFLDYASNVSLYPQFQEYFRTKRPPTLAVWGRNDPFFLPAGAEAFKRDNPDAEVRFYDTGHFALETHASQIAADIRRFLAKHVADVKPPTKSVTAVLVHAAWADGSSWNKVTGDLQRRGYRVVAAQIPLTSLSDDAAALRRVLDAIDGPVVLVGHSYGGAVVTKAATGNPRVKGLVYVAAMAPDEGESVGDLFFRAAPHPDAPAVQPDKDGFVSLDVVGFRAAAAPDATAEETALMAATQKPVSVNCIAENMTPPAWKEKPSWYLVAERDRMVSPDTQRFMAARIGAALTSLPVDHTPLASAPRAVADVIDAAAAATAPETTVALR